MRNSPSPQKRDLAPSRWAVLGPQQDSVARRRAPQPRTSPSTHVPSWEVTPEEGHSAGSHACPTRATSPKAPGHGGDAPRGHGHQTPLHNSPNLVHGIAASPPVPGLPCAYLRARQRAIMQNGFHWEKKKKKRGGSGRGIICEGFLSIFFPLIPLGASL